MHRCDILIWHNKEETNECFQEIGRDSLRGSNDG